MPITTAGNVWFLVKADVATEEGDAAVGDLCRTLEMLPGVRSTRVSTNTATYAKIIVSATRKGAQLALRVAEISAIYEPDHDAAHDHAGCVASAAKMGVPAAYAHTPETYLSM